MFNNFNVNLTIKGCLSVYRERPDGSRIFINSFTNVVTTVYKTRVMQKILSASDTSDIVVSTMRWGTGNNTAVPADITLQTQLTQKPLSNTPVISGSDIVYSGRLDLADANATLLEVGIFTADNTMVARVNITVIKTGLDVFVFDWTHSFIGA